MSEKVKMTAQEIKLNPKMRTVKVTYRLPGKGK